MNGIHCAIRIFGEWLGYVPGNIKALSEAIERGMIMTTYTISDRVFSLLPSFQRGVVIAKNVDNVHARPELVSLLAIKWAHRRNN